MIKTCNAFWLIFYTKDQSSIETIRVSNDLGYPRDSIKLFDNPIKLMNVDITDSYLIFLSENDNNIVILDCNNNFKCTKRIDLTSADKQWDDLLKHKLVYIGLATSDIIILLNEKGVFRLIDLSIEKPHKLNVVECQKYFKYDFTIKESLEYIPTVSDDILLTPMLKVDLVNSRDPMSDMTIVI